MPRLSAMLIVLLLLGACSTRGASSSDRAVPVPDGNEGGTVDVTLESEGLNLEGTYTSPPDAGPHPGVVIIHGSGPVSRDGTIPGQLNTPFPAPIMVYRDLAEGLASSGIASLRYDKRTCGPFNGCAENGYPAPGGDLTVDTFLADALAAIDWLSERDDISEVIALGHSQGATLAVLATDRRPFVSRAVLVGAPYRPIDLVTAQQAADSRLLATELGMSEDQINAAVAPLEQMAADVEAVRLGTYSGGPIAGVSVEFWKSWLDSSEEAQEVTRAKQEGLLVVAGGADTNVGSVELLEWQTALIGTGNQVVLLDCISHALNCIDGENIGAAVAPEVIETIARFIGG